LGEDAFLLAAFGVGFGQFGVFLFGSAWDLVGLLLHDPTVA
jgi:hypothetical protein